MNSSGQLVDSNGRIVSGSAGAITVPAGVSLSQLSVGTDGSISANGAAIGKFTIADFGTDEDKLVPVGLNCFKMEDETIRPAVSANAQVRQGYQESSNVQIVDELVDMIMVTRLYEANMKLLSAKTEAGKSIMSVAMG